MDGLSIGEIFVFLLFIVCIGSAIAYTIYSIKDFKKDRNNRPPISKEEIKRQLRADLDRIRRQAAIEKQLHKPKCPTCGSESVEKIGNLERTLDTSGFGTLLGGGLNSKTLGKSFKCKNCEYMW